MRPLLRFPFDELKLTTTFFRRYFFLCATGQLWGEQVCKLEERRPRSYTSKLEGVKDIMDTHNIWTKCECDSHATEDDPWGEGFNYALFHVMYILLSFFVRIPIRGDS